MRYPENRHQAPKSPIAPLINGESSISVRYLSEKPHEQLIQVERKNELDL
jgi:hypothetical protein